MGWNHQLVFFFWKLPLKLQQFFFEGKINSGLGGGAVVAIVLLTCCFTCSFVALAFYFWKGSFRKSALVDPEPVTPVIPASSPSPIPPVQVVLPPPPIPKDATQKALEEAINEQDLEKLHCHWTCWNEWNEFWRTIRGAICFNLWSRYILHHTVLGTLPSILLFSTTIFLKFFAQMGTIQALLPRKLT